MSFETRQYEVEEGDRSVELTLSLSQPVPFNTSLELHAIDDTTTSELCSVLIRACSHLTPYYIPRVHNIGGKGGLGG